MKVGDTFLLPDAIGTHLNVILAVLDNGTVIHCHFTHSDTTCVIKPGEHPFIKKETVVRYDQAQLCEDGPQLEALKRTAAEAKKLEPLSTGLLKKVIRGALDSPQTPDKIKVALK